MGQTYQKLGHSSADDRDDDVESPAAKNAWTSYRPPSDSQQPVASENDDGSDESVNFDSLNGYPRHKAEKLNLLQKLKIAGLLVLGVLAFGLVLTIIINIANRNPPDNHPSRNISISDPIAAFAKAPKLDCERSEVCLNHAAAMESTMDLTAEPCGDAYRYMCGNFKASGNHNAVFRIGVETFLDSMQAKTLQRMRDGIAANITEHDSETLKKAKLYYTVCSSPDEGADKTTFNEIRQQFGGFRLPSLPRLGSGSVPKFNNTFATSFLFPGQTLGLSLAFVVRKDLQNSSILLLDKQPSDLPSLASRPLQSLEKYYDVTSQEENDVLDQNLAAVKSVEDGIKILQEDSIQYNWADDIFGILGMVPMQKTSAEELTQLGPAFDWRLVLKTLANNLTTSVTSLEYNLYVTDDASRYLKSLSRFVTKQPPAALHNFMIFNVVDSLQDETELKDRCFKEMQDRMPYTLAVLVTPNTTIQNVAEMSQEIKQEFKSAILESKLLNEGSKQKLSSIQSQVNFVIGFPDSEEAFDLAKLDRLAVGQSSVANSINAYRFKFRQQLQQLGEQWNDKPSNIMQWADANAWVTSAQKVTFPFGIMQPTIYHEDDVDSFNYGGMGAVEGHELGHLFGIIDPETDKFMSQRSTCISEFYSNLKYNGMQYNGNLTVKDDMADVMGLQLAYNAFTKRLINANGAKNYTIKLPRSNRHLSLLQSFFVAFSQVHCASFTRGSLEDLITVNDHSVGPFRIIGTLAQSPAYAEAFKCPVNSPMNPVKRCNLT